MLKTEQDIQRALGLLRNFKVELNEGNFNGLFIQQVIVEAVNHVDAVRCAKEKFLQMGVPEYRFKDAKFYTRCVNDDDI